MKVLGVPLNEKEIGPHRLVQIRNTLNRLQISCWFFNLDFLTRNSFICFSLSNIFILSCLLLRNLVVYMVTARNIKNLALNPEALLTCFLVKIPTEIYKRVWAKKSCWNLFNSKKQMTHYNRVLWQSTQIGRTDMQKDSFHDLPSPLWPLFSNFLRPFAGIQRSSKVHYQEPRHLTVLHF